MRHKREQLLPMSSHKTEHVKQSRQFKAAAIAALIQRGWTQTELARRIRKSRPRVNQALNQGRHPRVQDAIRQALNLP